MLGTFIRHIIFTVAALCLAAPVAQAVEIDLDSYPSYLRTRARYFNRATFYDPNLISGNGRKDRIFFVDSTLRVSPALRLGESVQIVVQADIADNVIWGGTTDQLLGGGSTLVNSNISRGDSFRGSLLIPAYDRIAYLDRAVEIDNDGTPVLNKDAAVDPDSAWFNLRQAYVHIDLPDDIAFVRVGRQTFDWGLGTVSNGGNDPSSDHGTLIDRLLIGKTGNFISGSTITGLLFSDIWAGGTNLRASGTAYEAIGGAVVWNKPAGDFTATDFTLGSYIYPWIRHDNFARGGKYFLGGRADLERLTIYSFMLDLKRGDFRLAGEYHGAFGKVSNIHKFRNCRASECDRITFFNRADNTKIGHQMAWAARLEFVPEKAVQRIGGEFGWVDGDKAGEYWRGDKIDGGFLAFSPSYNVDHLLFRHVLPSIYQSVSNEVFSHTEGGIQNARYARFYVDFKLADWLTMKNQWLAAWTNETKGLFQDGVNVASFIGSEVETTFSFRLRKGVFLNFTGSAVFAGDGLRDMFEGQAFNEVVRRSDDDIYVGPVEGGNVCGVAAAAPMGQSRVCFVKPGSFALNERRSIRTDENETFQLKPGTGDPNSVPGLSATIGRDLGGDADERRARAQKKAYNALREEFSQNYPDSKNRIWSLQTVLTVHLDAISSAE